VFGKVTLLAQVVSLQRTDKIGTALGFDHGQRLRTASIDGAEQRDLSRTLR
jgi:hypothetical protein